MTSLDHLFVLAFAVLYPTYAFFVYRKIKPDLIADKPGVRWRDYRETSLWLWLFGLVGLANWVYQDRPLADLGFGTPTSWPAWLGLGLVTILSLLMAVQLSGLQKNKEKQQSLNAQLSKASASEFLPRTLRDMRWFVFLSFAAGICEEILFRGFLLWYFLHFSVPVAMILSSILFGLAHSYQGWQGVLRTGAMGFVLALAYVLTGSLWVPIFLHIAGDIYSGVLGRLAFAKNEIE